VDQDFSNLLISELMYHPKGSNDDAEFIELANVGREELDVGGLFLRMGTDRGWSGEYFHFPMNSRVGPGAFLVLVRRPDDYLVLEEARFASGVGFSGEGECCYLFSADSTCTLTGFSHGFHFSGAERGASFGRHVASHGSESLVSEDIYGFRQTFMVPAEMPVVAVPELLTEPRPDSPILPFSPAGRDGDSIRRMVVEHVDWKTTAPWPPGANAVGHSLQRLDPNRFAKEPANWRADPAYYERSDSLEGQRTRVVVRERFPVSGRDHAFVRLRVRLR